MQKPERVDRTMKDKREALREQVSLLASYAEQYDAGHIAYAKPMATALRLLIHQTKSSHSLLQQLGLRQGRFFAVAKTLRPGNLATECDLLVTMLIGGVGAKHLPCIRPMTLRDRVSFPEWWSASILKGRGGATMSRRDVITAVANTDGGAHFDAGLEKVYHSFRTGQLLGWSVNLEGGRTALQVGMADADPSADPPGTYLEAPQYACIRTIVHEFLLTMQKYAPWSFTKPYEAKET